MLDQSAGVLPPYIGAPFAGGQRKKQQHGEPLGTARETPEGNSGAYAGTGAQVRDTAQSETQLEPWSSNPAEHNQELGTIANGAKSSKLTRGVGALILVS